MEWILGAGEEIVVNVNQLKARSKYIHRVTNADVSDWKHFQMNDRQFLCCTSNDVVDGIFITAHIDDVIMLSALHYVFIKRITIANTCIWERSWDRKLLYKIWENNPNSDLYFSKQNISVDQMHILRPTTELLYAGKFGFQTSLSERELFMNREKGFEEALKLSFERVSPILMPGE